MDDFGNFYEPSLADVFELCIITTLTQVTEFIAKILVYNVAFAILTFCFCRSERQYHIFSTLIGLCNIFFGLFLFSREAYHIIPMVYISYILLLIFSGLQVNPKFPISILMISTLVSYELFYEDHEAWLKIRSVVMIVMLKIISLAFDYADQGIPNVWAFSGYIWCPANAILGPWITFKEYRNRMNIRETDLLYRFMNVMIYLLKAMLCITVSNCLASYLITDQSNKYLKSYRDALSFRMSHYFISFIASAAMVTAGFQNSNSDEWTYTVTKPREIEMPRSLVTVVINWNIPMHRFLKKYIFTGFITYGKFAAVLMTYLVSSLLHGMNVEVSMVLLSLGLFSYSQFKLQDVLAKTLNSCIRARPCRRCSHTNKYHLRSIMNGFFMAVSMIYLAYTGCLMDSINHTQNAVTVFWSIVQKWQYLNFYGHWVLMISMIVTYFVR